MKNLNRLKMLIEQFPEAKIVINVKNPVYNKMPPQVFGHPKTDFQNPNRKKRRRYPIRSHKIVVGEKWLLQGTREKEFATLVAERLTGRVIEKI
jgi:hypothetical protein